MQFLDLCVKCKEKKRQSFENVCKQLKKTVTNFNIAAARILSGARVVDHITPVLELLHWLRFRFR